MERAERRGKGRGNEVGKLRRGKVSKKGVREEQVKMGGRDGEIKVGKEGGEGREG